GREVRLADDVACRGLPVALLGEDLAGRLEQLCPVLCLALLTPAPVCLSRRARRHPNEVLTPRVVRGQATGGYAPDRSDALNRWSGRPFRTFHRRRSARRRPPPDPAGRSPQPAP